MSKNVQPSKSAAKSVSRALKDPSTTDKSKAAAGSALSQHRTPEKVTSPKSAKAASKVLKEGRTAKDSKSAAGSALSQHKASKKQTSPQVSKKGSNPLKDAKKTIDKLEKRKIVSLPDSTIDKKMNRLMDALKILLGKHRLTKWLNMQNAAFENQKPLDLIINGQADRIWQMIHQIEGNVAS